MELLLLPLNDRYRGAAMSRTALPLGRCVKCVYCYASCLSMSCPLSKYLGSAFGSPLLRAAQTAPRSGTSHSVLTLQPGLGSSRDRISGQAQRRRSSIFVSRRRAAVPLPRKLR